MSTILEAARQLEKGSEPPSTGGLPPRDPIKGRSLRSAAALAVIGIVAMAAALFFVARTTPSRVASAKRAVEPVQAAPVIAPTSRPENLAGPTPAPVAPEKSNSVSEAPWARVHDKKPPPEPPSEPRAAARAVVMPDGPSVSLHSIVCSAGGEQCSANMLIDGRGIRLQTGESFGGVEVQLVLADTVYIRRGGNVIALRAPR